MGHRGENETSCGGERSNHFCGNQNLHQQQVTTKPASKIAERETKAVMLGANPGRTLLFDLDMTVNIEKIYRVVCDDNYQMTTPKTYWTKDKQECESYIQSKYYKHCLRIEEAVLTDKALPVNGIR